MTGKLDGQEATLMEMIGGMTTKLKATIQDLTEITKVQKDTD